jgi:uncharacterized protein (DUF2141 family)
MKTPLAASIILFLVFFPLLHCAKEGMPPGGPEDTTPPKVVMTSPLSDSTHIALRSKIKITFSERMQQESVEGALFVSPFPQTPLEYGWQGKTLTLSSSEPWQKDRTYVVSIGTGAQDLHRNRINQTFTFAFSTGASIDQGSIAGEVWVKKGAGLGKDIEIGVWAYLLSEERSEVHPDKEKPDYVTQADEQGKYALKSLGWGKYRLFAVKDVNRDVLWSGEDEIVGVTTKDVTLSPENLSEAFVDFVLDKIDLSPPQLLNCRALNRNLVRLEFSEKMDDKSALDTSSYELSLASDHTSLPVISSFYPDDDTKTIFLLTAEMSSNVTLDLKVPGLKDQAGNMMDTVYNSCKFEGSVSPDTAGLHVLSVSPSNQARQVPLDAKIRLSFSQPPITGTVENNFSLVDSNHSQVPGKFEWKTPNTIVFSPDSLLSGKMSYTINLTGKGIRNLLGTTYLQDSLVSSSFVIINPDTLGEVSGKVVLNRSGDVSADLILTLWEPGGNGASYQIHPSTPDHFLFERILPGKYFLSGYLDLNHDRTFNLGRIDPYSPLEPFSVYPDTVYIRSRWETEGVELIFH